MIEGTGQESGQHAHNLLDKVKTWESGAMSTQDASSEGTKDASRSCDLSTGVHVDQPDLGVVAVDGLESVDSNRCISCTTRSEPRSGPIGNAAFADVNARAMEYLDDLQRCGRDMSEEDLQQAIHDFHRKPRLMELVSGQRSD